MGPAPEGWYTNQLRQWQLDFKDGGNILAAAKVDDLVMKGHLWAEATVWGPGGRDGCPCDCYRVRLIRPGWTTEEAAAWALRHVYAGAAEMGVELPGTGGPVEIWVNGGPAQVSGNFLAYRDVVALAFPGNPDFEGYTVVFTRSPGPQRKGSLLPGERVQIQDGTVFNVAFTGNA